ncbi:MAG: hypothetical protein MJZ81_09310 [Bacteroidales bacterium]|nr:hypothetical protein [Bacteroidales bacterium]
MKITLEKFRELAKANYAAPAPVRSSLLENDVTLGENLVVYLLEMADEKGEMKPFEVSVGEFDIEMSYAEEEIQIGLLKAFPDAWEMFGDDWYFRLGIDFDPRTTPTENPSENGVWEGVCKLRDGDYYNGKKWRVSRLTIDAVISEKAKAYFLENP